MVSGVPSGIRLDNYPPMKGFPIPGYFQVRFPNTQPLDPIARYFAEHILKHRTTHHRPPSVSGKEFLHSIRGLEFPTNPLLEELFASGKVRPHRVSVATLSDYEECLELYSTNYSQSEVLHVATGVTKEELVKHGGPVLKQAILEGRVVIARGLSPLFPAAPGAVDNSKQYQRPLLVMAGVMDVASATHFGEAIPVSLQKVNKAFEPAQAAFVQHYNIKPGEIMFGTKFCVGGGRAGKKLGVHPVVRSVHCAHAALAICAGYKGVAGTMMLIPALLSTGPAANWAPQMFFDHREVEFEEETETADGRRVITKSKPFAALGPGKSSGMLPWMVAPGFRFNEAQRRRYSSQVAKASYKSKL